MSNTIFNTTIGLIFIFSEDYYNYSTYYRRKLLVEYIEKCKPWTLKKK